MTLCDLGGQVAFGTNITLPPVLGNGPVAMAKSLARRAACLLNKGEWGKSATIRATDSLIPCVKSAVQNGILVFDCSRAYGGSEQRLAKALRGVPRDEVFIITKIDDPSQFHGRVEECFEESLRQLGTDYADLLLLHWPVDYPKSPDPRFEGSAPVYARSWKALEKIYESGRARAIGTANFNIVHLETLKKYADVMPMANEFECHPLCAREELNRYCADNGILVFAYASLCAMDERLLCDGMRGIADSHGKTVAQVILKWHTQKGRVPIFGTSRPERVREYSELGGFSLSDDEMAYIDGMNANYRAFPDSEHCDFTKNIWQGYESYRDNCP